MESQATVADRVREILKEQGCGEFGEKLADLVSLCWDAADTLDDEGVYLDIVAAVRTLDTEI